MMGEYFVSTESSNVVICNSVFGAMDGQFLLVQRSNQHIKNCVLVTQETQTREQARPPAGLLSCLQLSPELHDRDAVTAFAGAA